MATLGGDEAEAGVERLHLGQRTESNGTGAIGGAVEYRVVEDHHVAVGGAVDVELEAIRPSRQAGGE
jgi:hypothetical protein